MRPDLELLSDLARLATKHEPKAWRSLIALLDDDEGRQRVRALLVELAGASGRPRRAARRSAKRPSRAAQLRRELVEVRGHDPARGDLLEDIWLKLRERELLPSLAAIRAFAEALGLKGIRASRRDQAVLELMEHLIRLPAEDLERRMRETAVSDRKLGDEYEHWVRLILEGPKQRPPK